MQNRKSKTAKATQPQQSLYKGAIKVTPNTKEYVPIRKYMEILQQKIAIQDELISLKQNEDCNQRKAIFYDITNYHPFHTKFNLPLN